MSKNLEDSNCSREKNSNFACLKKVLMKRKAYYDVLRVTAIVLVLLNHLPAYRLYMQESGMAEAGCLVFSVIIRINVPLFALLSGALLLGRNESYAHIWKHRLSNILLVTLACTVLLYLDFGWLRDRQLSLHDLFYGLLGGNLRDFDSYWFLYAYMGFLLFLPLYRHIAQAMTRQDFYMLLGAHAFLGTLLPLINLLLRFSCCEVITLSGSLNTALAMSPLVFYPLIGFYIDKRVDVEAITLKQWVWMALAVVVGVVIACASTYAEGQIWKFSQSYLGLFTYLIVIVFFLFIKKVYSARERRPSAFIRLMSVLSPLCFGVYLFDPILKLLLYEPVKTYTADMFGFFFFSIIMCFISFLCCGTFTWLFLWCRRKIKD